MTRAAERRRAAAARAGERGFTLIEALVGLAILGFAAAMLAAGIGMVGIGAARAGVGGARLDQVASAQMLLRARLERLRPVLRLDSAVPVVDARGTETVFDFVAPPLDRDAPDALVRYRLTLAASGDLTLYAASMLDPRVDVGNLAAPGWTPHRLMSGIASLAIAYYGADGITGGGRWQTRWSDHPQPPDLIRIRLTFPPGDARVWPDLLIRPRATANAACRIDERTGRCGSAS